MGDLRGFRVKVGDGLRLVSLAAMGLVWVVSVGVASGQAPNAGPKTMLALPPAPLLPQTLGKLTRVAESDVGDGLGSLDATDAPVLTEDGLKRFARSEYLPESKSSAIVETVTVYKFMDASGAVAAYDYFHKPGMRPVKLGDTAVADWDELLVRSGVNVARVTLKSRSGMEVKGEWEGAVGKELIDHLPKVGGTAGLAPLLPTLLPAKGLDAESVKYALGPAAYQAMGGVLPAEMVGFDKSAETVTAKYKAGGLLTLLLYPTPQIAGDRDRAIEAQLSHDSAAGTVKLRREGPLVLLTTGPWTPSAAQAMVDGIHLRTEVSFDKPVPLEFHAEVQKTYSLLTSISIFCGVGALAAVVLGLFFGGGRAMVRVMQGKPAASEPEFLRIDLRGQAGEGISRNPDA
jgi:hypothetical protein